MLGLVADFINTSETFVCESWAVVNFAAISTDFERRVT
jgi:hypothetical protein